MFRSFFTFIIQIHNCLYETVFQYLEHNTTLLKIFLLPYKINKLKILFCNSDF